jgi:hypothetical protein
MTALSRMSHHGTSRGSTVEGQGFLREDLLIDGLTYPRLKSAGGSPSSDRISEIVEVHWAEIMRPAESVVGMLQHLLYVPLAMALVMISPGPLARRPPWLGRLHFWLFGLTYLWILLGSIMVMGIVSCGGAEHAILRWTMAAVFPAAMCVLAWFFGRYHPAFRAGLYWAPLTLATGVMLNVAPALAHTVTAWTAYAYGWLQSALSCTFFLAMIEAFWIRRGHGVVHRLVGAAFVWIPFVLFCALVAAAWGGSLQLAHTTLDDGALKQWSRDFLGHLPYDLRTAEISLTAATLGAILLPAVVGAGVYFAPARLRNAWGLSTPGESARNVIPFALWIGPIALGLGYGAISLWGRTPNPSDNIIEIYQFSALRLYSLLPLVAPGVRAILDAVGDIVFFILPPPASASATGPTLSVRGPTLSRLEQVLKFLRASRPQNDIVVLAHSQGSVLAYTVLEENPALADRLITMGSPLASLYGRFLQTPISVSTITAGPAWLNMFRAGDYIGGPIPGVERGGDIGKGGHVNYWGDAEVHGILREILSDRAGDPHRRCEVCKAQADSEIRTASS